MTDTIIHGDCLDALRRIAAESIDMIITDPPYGIDYQSCSMPKDKRPKKIANDKRPFIWWLYDAFRLLRQGGGILCFARWDVQQVFIDAMRLAGFTIKTVLIWDRMAHGMGDLTGNFAPQYDVCIFAVKGKYTLPGARAPDVLRHMKVNSQNLVHPNEKPVPLMRQLIEITTKPGDTVLDPFVGSGSTLVAAVQAGRRYIGVEIDAEYYALAQKRVIEAIKNRLLNGVFE